MSGDYHDGEPTSGGAVGITATRDGLTPAQLSVLLRLLRVWEPAELHHGDCVGGDLDAATAATGLGIKTVAHPPSNPKLQAHHASTRVLPPEEYRARNRAIVHATGVLVAFPKEPAEQRFGGTWGTVVYARSRGRAVVLVLPDGTIQEERNRDPRYRLPEARR